MRLGKCDAAYVGSLERFCEGALDSSRYILSVKSRVVAAPSLYGDGAGSPVLDETNAFDLAEARGPYMGQINLIQVSSFCGPLGLIWGYDLAAHSRLRSFPVGEVSDGRGRVIPVYDARMLELAASELFGTVTVPNFPIAPGSLCPSAYKSFACKVGSGSDVRMFAVLALGIPEDRQRHACILMEDVGVMDPSLNAAQVRMRTAASIVGVASNQLIRCREIFIVYDEATVRPHEVGCALVAAPYFRLARQSLPPGGLGRLRDLTLLEWKLAVAKR